MRKKLLPLAMLAGLAGAARAAHVTADGAGKVLIYPYFSDDEALRKFHASKLQPADFAPLTERRFMTVSPPGSCSVGRAPAPSVDVKKFWQKFNETIKSG